MSELKNAQINVQIDGKQVKTISNRVQRNDVLNAIKGYGGNIQNPRPGYEEYIDLSSYRDGIYSFTLNVIDPNTKEILETTTRTIKLKKYPTTMNLEEPLDGKVLSDTITVKGWVMSQNKDAQIKILINNQEVKTVSNRLERQDVLNAIKGYGNVNQNPKPGYKETINLSSYNEGTHKLTIKVIDTITQEILETTTRSFKISRTSPYYYGIDVSHHQGTIDWAKVKNDGVDFAILRAGYRGWGISADGTDGKLVKDSKFDYNATNAIKNGVPIGAYFFSQAINEKEAIEEANFMLSTIKNYNITYPVAIDVEYSGAPNNTGRADNVTKEMRTKICDAFLTVIKNAGYTPMIYADKYFASANLDMTKLNSYQFWLAHYTGTTQENPFAKPSDYKGNYKMWQYTSKGKVNGISTDVDMNIWYK